MREDQPDALGMLIRHELAIKRLYEIFGAMFTNRQDFWQSLAGDEQKHADWLGTLQSELTPGKRLLHDSRLKPEAIQSSAGYVESQIVRAQEGNFSLLEALSIARDLESALLEKQFSKIGDSVSKDFRAILMDLIAETERHRKTIAEALDTEKRQIS